MSLRPFVAELEDLSCPQRCHTTWTIWAKNIAAATKKLEVNTGMTVITVNPLGSGLRRHWRAG